MSLHDSEDIFRALADSPEDYQRDGWTITIVRQGDEHVLKLADIAGAGTCVVEENGKPLNSTPIDIYAQRLLNLPKLAIAITKHIDKVHERAALPIQKYIESPAWCLRATGPLEEWAKSGVGIINYLQSSPTGTTHIIHLMADAGKGKTYLLEHVAKQLCTAYQPTTHPTPIVLPIDLLGRNIGSIEDAIAGSFANTYNFHGLNMEDVVLCIRKRWVVLALDGFDELVSRVGVREAFTKLTDLVDKLKESGTLILSARDSFFTLSEVEAGINRFLLPTLGSYDTTSISLLDWGEIQAQEVLAELRSPDPAADARKFLSDFGGDKSILYHPFFLTRLGPLWLQGTTVKTNQAEDLDTRTARIIEMLIEAFIDKREAAVKWVDRDKKPLLSPEQHALLLGSIAAEMWQAGTNVLDADEIRLVAELACSELKVSGAVSEIVVEKSPKHAALTQRAKKFSFLHEKFFSFYLGHRLASILLNGDMAPLRRFLDARGLPPEALRWTMWGISRSNRSHKHQQCLSILNTAVSNAIPEGLAQENAGRLLSELLHAYSPPSPMTVAGQFFTGLGMSGRSYQNLVFTNCRFVNADFTSTSIEKCTFVKCEFRNIRCNSETRLLDSKFQDTTIQGIRLGNLPPMFDPAQVNQYISSVGAIVQYEDDFADIQRILRRVDSRVIAFIDGLVRTTRRVTDFTSEEMEEEYGKFVPIVLKIGRETGVLKPVSKAAQGNHKTFFRLTVDRDRLFLGHVISVNEPSIDLFWTRIAEKYPAR